MARPSQEPAASHKLGERVDGSEPCFPVLRSYNLEPASHSDVRDHFANITVVLDDHDGRR